MEIQKDTIVNVDCFSLEYVLDQILIDNSPEAIRDAAAYIQHCNRNSWKDIFMDLDTVTEILDEMVREGWSCGKYKDIYNDEDFEEFIMEMEDAPERIYINSIDVRRKEL